MRLEELLFCTVFLGLPLVGMVGMMIARLFRESTKAVGEVSSMRMAAQKTKMILKKRASSLPIPAFANDKVMTYQLIESQVHIPIHFKQMKKRAQPRAGP